MIKLPEWIKKTDVSHKAEVEVYNENSALAEAKAYLKAIWQRIVDWKHYPRDYINLYESQGTLSLCHFKNNLLVHVQEVNLDDYEWRQYVCQHSSLPIHLILQGQDCEFRSFPTKQINLWDRFFLFNQLKTNEFDVDDLLNHYQPKQHFEKVDILAAIRSNDRLKQIYKVMASFKNPIGGVISWDIEQSMLMKKQASITRALRHWVVTLIPMENHKFTMLVMCQDTILLQRVVHSKTTSDIEKELRSTLRFLQRQGYQEGQAVSVLVPEDTLEIDEFSHAEFEAVAVSKHLLEKEAYKPTKCFLNFIPQILRQANLAYHLPRLAIKFLIPISAILLILWASVQIKSFFQDYECKWLHNKYEKTFKKTTSNFAEQVHLSKLFMSYVIAGNNNPSKTMNNVNRLLKGKAQVLGVVWAPTARGTELRLKFSSVSKAKNQDFKKYISQNCERVLGDVSVTWDDQANETILLIQQQAVKYGN